MHPTVVGLPCRLVLMAAHPGFPVDRPCDRQVPRAPSPHVGVTLMGKTSCAFSKGITLPSSLIWTHAPSLYPPFDFRNALIRKVFAGCCQPLLRKGSSQRYLCRPSLRAGTPTPAAPKVLSPVSSLGTLAFPVRTAGRRLATLPSQLLRMAGDFGAAVIPLRSGPQVCSPHR